LVNSSEQILHLTDTLTNLKCLYKNLATIIIEGSYLRKIVGLMLVKKNITKAIYIADYLIDAHNRNAKGIEELVKNWKSHNTGSQELGLEIASVHRAVAVAIGYIKELLEEKPKEKKIVKAVT